MRARFNEAFRTGFPILPKFRANQQYTISLKGYNSSEISYTQIQFHYTDGTYTSILITGTTPQTFTGTSTSGKTVANIVGTFGSEGTVLTYIKDFMLVEGSTASDYEPYTGNQISVNWEDEAGTVYGGTLDVVSGKITVTKAVYVLDGSQDFDRGDAGNNWRWKYNGELPIAGISPGIEEDVSKSEISSQFVGRGSVYADSARDVGFIIRDVNLWIRFGADTTITTAALVKQFFTDHPTTFVYDMAIPIEYTLTANELATLYGQNNIWSNTGDVTVTYIAKSAKFSFGSPLHTYNYNNLKLFGNTYIEHGKG